MSGSELGCSIVFKGIWFRFSITNMSEMRDGLTWRSITSDLDSVLIIEETKKIVINFLNRTSFS